jgi:hypothetical protein
MKDTIIFMLASIGAGTFAAMLWIWVRDSYLYIKRHVPKAPTKVKKGRT